MSPDKFGPGESFVMKLFSLLHCYETKILWDIANSFIIPNEVVMNISSEKSCE